MKALQCEMCGSQDLVKDGGVFICQSCGTKYTVEEAKKMMIEGTVDVKGTVKVDTTEELNNLYELARRSKDDHNDENALKYYDMILVKDPNSWEANFFVVYYQTMTCKIGQISNAAYKLEHCLDSVFMLINNNIHVLDKRDKAINEVFEYTVSAARVLSSAAYKHFEGIDIQFRYNYVQEYVNNEAAVRNIFYTLGNLLISYFGDKYSNQACDAWKRGIVRHSRIIQYIQQKKENVLIINKYTDKIRTYEPYYQDPTEKTKNACYVATAVYGSYDCPEVWTLRRFRDYTLAETWYGMGFIKTYYAISPSIVKWFGKTSWFKALWRMPLDKLVSSLNNKGVLNTPYKDREF